MERLWTVLKKTVLTAYGNASKQFSSFMELLVQLCLTLCATVSYGLWQWLASSSPIYGTACATVSYGSCNLVLQLCNCVLRLVEMVTSSSFIYGNGFRSGTSENQRLHKKLGNLKIGLHTDLGNSRTKKASLKQELVELRSQLETECAYREETEAELFELKQNSAPAATVSEKLTSDAATILSQL